MTVTLRDVAARAGVSISTVSRVLDDRLPPSNTAAAQRVREAATALGYLRDVNAAALRRAGGTGTIGVLVPRLTDIVMGMMFEAIFAEAQRRGDFALVSISSDDPIEERRALQSLLARRVDGVVLASSRLDDDLPKSLRDQAIAHVLVLRSDRVSPSSVSDDVLGGQLATRHLLDLGHRKIGILAGPTFASTAQDRLTGYRQAMREAGIDVPSHWIQHSTFGSNGGAAATRELLSADPTITALFGVNDMMVLGAIGAASAAGRSIPDDLSVVGYNDTIVGQHLPTPLTSVHVPFEQVAAGALDLLADWVSGGRVPDGTLRTVLPTLIPRGSSRPPAR